MYEEEISLNKRDQLALAIAQGNSIAGWARQNQVPESTAYKWSCDPDLRHRVRDLRRRYFDRTHGWLSVHSLWAVKGVKKLAEAAENESIQLRARRAILHDLMKVTEFADMEDRVESIEEEIRVRNEDAQCPA
jgi:hypothetical protein